MGRGSQIPQRRLSELEPAQARTVHPGPRGPAARAPPGRPLPAGRPTGLAPLLAPRARPGACAHARDPGAQRAPSLTADPGAQRPIHRPALTRCLGRRSPPRRPRRSEGCSARPSLSPRPPHQLGLSPFSRRNRGPALRPSSPDPSPLITPSTHPGPSTAFAAARPDVRCPRRCRAEKKNIAARSPGAGPCVRRAAGRRRLGGCWCGGSRSPPRCAQAIDLGSPGENAAFPRALRGGAQQGRRCSRSGPGSATWERVGCFVSEVHVGREPLGQQESELGEHGDFGAFRGVGSNIGFFFLTGGVILGKALTSEFYFSY